MKGGGCTAHNKERRQDDKEYLVRGNNGPSPLCVYVVHLSKYQLEMMKALANQHSCRPLLDELPRESVVSGCNKSKRRFNFPKNNLQ